MQYLWRHAETMLSEYDGSLPLQHFLKSYYRNHPKLGSRDRRMLSDMAYAWHRCSKGFPAAPGFPEKMLASLHCAGAGATLQRLLPQNADRASPLQNWNPGLLFPFPEVSFSAGIARDSWMDSMRVQPLLFLRIRTAKAAVEKALRDHGVDANWLSDTCVALPNGTDVARLLPGEAYVIQDSSSQKTGNFFKAKSGETWWDCCSGAGGKSLLLTDAQPNVQLTVSDLRASILHNLKERFGRYRLPQPKALCVDAGDAAALRRSLGNRKFDAIVCDAPCSGSGTWARTPEQLYFFRPERMEEYAARQTAILGNAVAYLKPGARVVYVTCSVFEAENEAVVRRVAERYGLAVQEQRLINGISERADSLFVAVLEQDLIG